MYQHAPVILATILAAIVIVRAALRFDRKMVEAGQRRRLEAEAKANGNAATGAPVQLENHAR